MVIIYEYQNNKLTSVNQLLNTHSAPQQEDYPFGQLSRKIASTIIPYIL